MTQLRSDAEVWAVPAHVPADMVADVDIFADVADDEDPYAAMAALQSGRRVFFNINKSPRMAYGSGYWVLTKAEDIRAALQQPDLFSSSQTASFSALFGETWKLIPLEIDPPDHAKWRTVLNSMFSPTRIGNLETGVRTRALELIDAFAAKGACAFIEDFGRPFPVSVFMQLMGLPEADEAQFVEWEHGLLHANDPQILAQSAHAVATYLRALIEKRKREPTDDLTSFCIKAGIDGRPATDDEILGICFVLVLAGLDTVAASLGLFFRHLAVHQEHQELLRAQPDLIPSAVEELLRRYAIVTGSRAITEDTVFAGAPMRKGDRVIYSTISANLDSNEFDAPLNVDLQRFPNRHTSFAYGPHRCLGSHLARRELVIAMQEFLKRIPQFAIAPGQNAPIKPGGIMSVPSLPLVWDSNALK